MQVGQIAVANKLDDMTIMYAIQKGFCFVIENDVVTGIVRTSRVGLDDLFSDSRTGNYKAVDATITSKSGMRYLATGLIPARPNHKL